MVADIVADKKEEEKVADIESDMVDDMEVDKVVDKVVDMVADMVAANSLFFLIGRHVVGHGGRHEGRQGGRHKVKKNQLPIMDGILICLYIRFCGDEKPKSKPLKWKSNLKN